MDATTWQSLNQYKKWGSFEGDYPPYQHTFFSPDDDVHGVITTVIRSARQVLSVAMFGWDDAEINDLFLAAWKDRAIRVKIALDASQSGGLGEKPLLAKWPVEIYGNDLIIGSSRKHA